MPHAWRISIAVTLIFPVIGMIADKRRHGRVHPAWWWSVGAIIVVQVAADIIAYSPWGVGVTEALIAGTTGAARPIASFMPPEFYSGPAAPTGGSAFQPRDDPRLNAAHGRASWRGGRVQAISIMGGDPS